ncbi:MAG: lysylphosphatidylglycerol synthase domain-containing protein [Acidimicrobiales bacterium]
MATALWRWTDWGVVSRAGRTLAEQPGPLAAALAAYTLAFVLRAAAWGPLLPVPVSLGRRFRAILAMLAVNHALPGPVGEVARAKLVAAPAGHEPEDDQNSFRQALASVAAARVVDAGAIAVLAMAAASLAGEAPAWLRLAAPLAVVLPFGAWAVARRRGASFTARQAAEVAAWAVPSWALELGVMLVVARAAGVELSPAAALLATCGGVLAQVAAVLPGGVGTYEAGVSSVLVPLGVPLGEAVGVAATAHAVKFAFAFVAGALALAGTSPGIAGNSVRTSPPAGGGLLHNERPRAVADVRP